MQSWYIPLAEVSVARGPSAHSPAVSSQTHGSKEDFAEGFLSELCEDGPDLTPRTWDMFASAIGMQETAEMEGEDVVLGNAHRGLSCHLQCGGCQLGHSMLYTVFELSF